MSALAKAIGKFWFVKVGDKTLRFPKTMSKDEVLDATRRQTGERLYHGSNTEFDAFDPRRTGDRLTSLGQGHYLTPNKDMARQYGDKVMEFDVDTSDILNWSDLSKSQRKQIESELLKVVPEPRISHFGKPKYEVLPKGSEGAKRFKELKEKTSGAYNDYAKARTLDDDEIPQDILSNLTSDDVVVGWREGADLSSANGEQLMTLMNEYSPNLAKDMGYKGARFGEQVAIYDPSLALKADPSIPQGLDMSHSARMQRAKEQGFDRDLKHKTWSDTFDDFTEFDKSKFGQNDYGYAGRGVYTTREPLGGTTYGNISMPLKGKLENPYTITPDNWQSDELNPYSWIANNSEKYGSRENASKAWTEMMQKNGYDGFIDNSTKNGEVVVFDPKNIRSINAAFDPTQKESSNLLASAAPLGVAGLLASEDDTQAGVINKAGKKIIEAWHGTPHNFDKFDMSKIGTGEGAQAYGHGLYFADQKKVGEQYRDDLSRTISYEGKPILKGYRKAGTTGNSELDDWIMAFGDDMAEFEKHMDETRALSVDESLDDETRQFFANELKMLEDAKDKISVEGKGKGSLYNVHIDATPDELLDWDKPLSEQPEAVQKTVQDFMDLKGVEHYDPDGTRVYLNTGITGDTKGSDIYRFLKQNASSPEQVSKELNTRGIKGIQYADGMTRHTDQATKNYVAFDDKIISIAKKYGIAPGAVTTAMLMDEEKASADSLLMGDPLLRPKNESQAIGIPDGWRGNVHDAGTFLKQNLDFPLGGTWFENLGSYLTDLSEGQKKSLAQNYWDSLMATLDIAP